MFRQMVTDLKPEEGLRSYISKYSFINLSKAFYPEPYIPDGAVKMFIYERGEPIRYCTPDEKKPDWKDGVIGTLSSGFTLEVHRPMQLTICCFRASAFYQLFKIPIYLMRDDFIPLEEMIGSNRHMLKDRLAHAATPQDKKKILDLFFLSLLRRHTPQDLRGIDKIEQAILCYPGKNRLEVLLGHTDLSKRSVERLFGNYIGMSPKQFWKAVRFNHAYLMRNKYAQVSWREIIHHCGYYDQSHYIQEFRAFTGVSPGTYNKMPVRMSSLYTGTYISHLHFSK